MTGRIDEAIEALLAYQQADMEGVMVLTSRQAIHEVADELRRLRDPAQKGRWLTELEIAELRDDARKQMEDALAPAQPAPHSSAGNDQVDWEMAYRGAMVEIEALEAIVKKLRNEPQTSWQPIETAPKDAEATFLVCAVGDDRGPFVVRSDIMWQARKAGTPSHLGLSYLTHWMPLPEMPQ